MHLSGPAHQLIGKETARLVRGNETVNNDARQRAMSENAAEKKKEQAPQFDLTFPPGY